MVKSCRRSHFSNSRQYPEFSWGEKKASCPAIKPFDICSVEEEWGSYSGPFTGWQFTGSITGSSTLCAGAFPPTEGGSVCPVDGCQNRILFCVDQAGKCSAPGLCKLDRYLSIVVREFLRGWWSWCFRSGVSWICQTSAESDKREPKPFGGLRTAEGRGRWRGWSVKWCVLAQLTQPMSLLNCLEFPFVFKTIDTNLSLSSFLKSCFQWLCSGKILCFPWLMIPGLGPGDVMQLVPLESLAQPAPAGVLWVQTQRQAHEAPANGGGQCLALPLGTVWAWLFVLACLWPKGKCRGSSGTFALGQISGKASMQRHNFPFLWLGFDGFCFCSCVWCQPGLCSLTVFKKWVSRIRLRLYMLYLFSVFLPSLNPQQRSLRFCICSCVMLMKRQL